MNAEKTLIVELCLVTGLTAMLRFKAQAAASAEATSITQRPSGMISPVCSAIGMNSSGEMAPRVRMVPAQQRLIGHGFTRGGLADRLVGQGELLQFHGDLQILHQRRGAGAPAWPSSLA